MSDWWTVPRIWEGCSVFIIGGGPSLRDFNFGKLEGKQVIGCNDAFRLGPAIVPVSVFGDQSFYKRNKDDLAKYNGIAITNHQSLRGKPYIKVTARENTKICTGNHLGWFFNTGCLAINLAVSMGAGTIYLLGYDMQMVPGDNLTKTPRLAIANGADKPRAKGIQRDSNWYPNIGSNNTEKTYMKFKHYFNLLKKDLDAKFPGVKIFNCNPDSGLDIFPKVKINEILP